MHTLAKRASVLGWLLLLGWVSHAAAATYNLSAGQYPPCNTSWAVSGTTYTCTGNGRVTLASGDILSANTTITIVANNGFSLNNNTVGSAANNINLQSTYGAFDAVGTNTINGNITATSGVITLVGTRVTGSITTSGNINLTGGSVEGLITSTNNTITTNGTDLQGGATARSGMTISGGIIAGAFTMTSNNTATFSGVTMTSGSISGASTVTISGGSMLGGPGSAIVMSSNSGAITVNNATVYGDLTAPGYSTVNVTNGASVFGTCSPGSTPANACTPASTLLGSWRMDEPFWNGTPNEVIDSSGNNNHGRARIAAGSTPTATTALATPAFASGSQSTCSYGQFDSTVAPVRTHTYVELSGFPALPTSFTFTAWIRSTHASAQHQRILVRDDAQNGWGLSLADGTNEPRLRFFNRNIQNSGAVTGQGRNGNCGVFCLDTDPVLTSNAWHFIAAAIDTSARRVTLYVYNQSGTLLAQTSSAFSGNWVDGTGTAAIGGETLASAEGRQSSFHFLGNIDEVEIYTGVLSQAYIESLRTRVRTCPPIAPHHYELQVPTSSISCLATPVTVVACADASVPCTNAYLAAGGRTAQLSTSAGVLASNTLTFSNAGVATTTLTHPQAIEGALATLSLANEQLPGQTPRRCCQGNSCSIANSCSTTFTTAGLAFATQAQPDVLLIPHQVAGVTDTTPVLRAVRTNTTTGACEARTTGTRTVQLGYECRDPSSCVAGQTLSLNNTAVQANSQGAPLSYTPVSLVFNASGTAPLPLNYSDVGRVRLHARLELPAETPQPAVSLTGSSNEFVVRPHSLVVTQVPGNPGTTGTGSGFVAAGAPFSVYLEARNASGARTPNFGNEAVSERDKVVLEAQALVYPVGGQLPALVQQGAVAAAAPAGTLVHSNLVWPEAGSIRLQPRLAGAGYLNTGQVSLLTQSDTVGRFYPHSFHPTSDLVADSCSGFSYMNQPGITVNYRLEARALGGTITANYDNDTLAYAGAASVTPVAENALSGDGANWATPSRLQVASAPWRAGVLAVNDPQAALTRQSSTQPDGPYEALQLGLSLVDSLDGRALQGANMNPWVSGSCTASDCTAIALGNPLELRFGRLRLDSAYGPETHDLPVNFVTEYWNGNHFVVARDDNCTAIPRSAISYPGGTLASDDNRTVALGGGVTQGHYAALDSTQVLFSGGQAGHWFSAPGAGNTGSFMVSVALLDLPWLRFDWNQDGDHNNTTTLPPVSIGFGSYRGHDRVIYWREILE